MQARRLLPTPTVALLALPLGLGLVGSLTARPKPTPLADLISPPPRRASPRFVPSPMPLDLHRLASLGDFHLVFRQDGFLDGPRMKAALVRPHDFEVAGRALIYEVEGEEAVPVGLGKVVELHPLGSGRDRAVLSLRLRHLKVERAEGGDLVPVWAEGHDPARGARYFVYPGNFTGMPYRDFERLAEGRLWVGMEADLLRLALGAPATVDVIDTGFGVRERWGYPRSARFTSWFQVAGGQLKDWWDDWKPMPTVDPIPGRSRDWWP